MYQIANARQEAKANKEPKTWSPTAACLVLV